MFNTHTNTCLHPPTNTYTCTHTCQGWAIYKRWWCIFPPQRLLADFFIAASVNFELNYMWIIHSACAVSLYNINRPRTVAERKNTFGGFTIYLSPTFGHNSTNCPPLHAHTHTYTHIHTYIHTYTCTHIHVDRTCVCTCVCLSVCLSVCMCVLVYIMFVCAYMYVWGCVHAIWTLPSW